MFVKNLFCAKKTMQSKVTRWKEEGILGSNKTYTMNGATYSEVEQPYSLSEGWVIHYHSQLL